MQPDTKPVSRIAETERQEWSVVDSSWETSAIFNQHGDCIAHVFISGDATEDTQDRYERIKEGHAQKIAAAPDMYEALKAADAALASVTAFEDDARYIMGNTNFALVQQRRDQIRAALAKARGEAA
ncbi:hypothetical protein [Brevundimonas sp.]|uniref:hypothetical protein n=1 Tax=Brevundimonas sp. TaxID=1871086 RepID=UPI0028A1E8F0|nr:hypothetical protein [Brevundimonas sp.]